MPVSSASKAPNPLTRKISWLTYDFHVYMGETAWVDAYRMCVRAYRNLKRVYDPLEL